METLSICFLISFLACFKYVSSGVCLARGILLLEVRFSEDIPISQVFFCMMLKLTLLLFFPLI